MVCDVNNRIDWLPTSLAMTDVIIFTLCSQLRIHHASKLGTSENFLDISTGVNVTHAAPDIDALASCSATPLLRLVLDISIYIVSSPLRYSRGIVYHC